MFERFTKDARDVVTGAVEHSERKGADSITEEHVLLAMLDQTGTRVSFAFAALGVADRRESLETALDDARRRGGLSRADEQALAGLGIDVTEIVSRVEDAHGRGALQGAGRPRRWWPGHRGFTPTAKNVLEKSLRIAVGRGDRLVGVEHFLLALTACPGVVADVLEEHGVTYGAVERVVFGGGEERAG
ncbi:Clp protease N-terminal domain-containing protein [Streptomyces sp. NPDC051907]|uniref:Clp protease N-terminal domain-containing protein n=1 Tax=Streptomyces sp. NPDC051907 TaxID=3155284 RepID=UPI00343AD102